MRNLFGIKTHVIILLFFVVVNGKSQIDTIYFSVSGDTVLYSFGAHGQVGSDTFYHQVIIASFNPKDTLKIISSFEIPTVQKTNALKLVSKDTIKKYHLQFDGLRSDKPDKNVKLKVSAGNIVFQSAINNSGENIYTADISIYIKCKSKLIRKEKIKYMFRGFDKTDLDTNGICDLTFWKKSGKDKYLFYYHIIRNKKITENDKQSSYDLISYLDYY